MPLVVVLIRRPYGITCFLRRRTMATDERMCSGREEKNEACPPLEKKLFGRWTVADMQLYFSELHESWGIPIYLPVSQIGESPMNALVPPRMESLFLAHRGKVGVSKPFPHALLVRDWPSPQEVLECSWWRAFWREREVRRAMKLREKDVWGWVIDEAAEYTELCPAGPVKVAFRFRYCDLAASFDRGRFHQRQFDMWLWHSFYSNPHMLPTLGCLVNMIRLKQLLWNRYGFFFPVDVIEEVYPDNELAGWVINAYNSHSVATPTFRDEEISYECRNKFFANEWPPKIRSFEEEVRIQERRRLLREKCIEYDHGGVKWYDSQLCRRIWDGEALPASLLANDNRVIKQRAVFWKRRREPLKEQHDAGVPNRAEWGALRKKLLDAATVSQSLLVMTVYKWFGLHKKNLKCQSCLFHSGVMNFPQAKNKAGQEGDEGKDTDDEEFLLDF